MSGEHNYSDPLVQSQIEHLTQTFENTSYVSGSLYTESWIRSFIQYAKQNEDYLNISISTEDKFIAALKEVSLAFRCDCTKSLIFFSCGYTLQTHFPWMSNLMKLETE